MFGKTWLKVAVISCLMLLLSSPALAETIRIAVASPFTGALAGYGDNVKAGVTLKVEEINAAGGINGKQIRVDWMDEQCEPREAATVSSRIAQNRNIVGVVGHLCSSAHLAALPTYLRHGVPVISPTATSVAISDQSKDRQGNTWAFRVVYRDDYQGEFLAQYVNEVLELDNVAVFFENNDYGIGLKNAFVNKAQSIGLNIVGEEAYVSGASDFNPQLTRLRGRNPDGLFISGYYPEGALIANQARDLGMNVAKFGADGFDNADYISLAGAAAENTYLTVPFLADVAEGEAKEFLENFRERFDREVDWMSANSYDAAGILLQAIAEVGADRAKIREYLTTINSPENAYHGIAGMTYFNEYGDTLKPAFVKKVQDGQFVAAPVQMD
ncbi:ABC transporter substrate-binding protein [Desulfonatronovibrio magnus]|uniref:ABC transporter substrate-binding protein n=1 Tax=Desulfonatronovibrio magnus TaxID=698827 RepID=UPI0005EBE8F0|nr:ABC transporter substrate-binding protein [Desulfonatronovibrio magnus]